MNPADAYLDWELTTVAPGHAANTGAGEIQADESFQYQSRQRRATDLRGCAANVLRNRRRIDVNVTDWRAKCTLTVKWPEKIRATGYFPEPTTSTWADRKVAGRWDKFDDDNRNHELQHAIELGVYWNSKRKSLARKTYQGQWSAWYSSKSDAEAAARIEPWRDFRADLSRIRDDVDGRMLRQHARMRDGPHWPLEEQ